MALQNHPSTKRAWWNAKRAAAAVGSSKSGYFPTLDLNIHGDHGHDFQFVEGPDVTYMNVGANLVLGWLLFDFGERSAGVCMAKQGLAAANWQFDWTLQSVMVRTLENGYSVLYAEEALKAALESLEDAEKMYEAAVDLYDAGLRSITDVYTSEATLAQMRMEAVQFASQLDIQRASLAASIGYCADTPLEVAPIDELPEHHVETTQALIDLGCSQRADLMAKQAQVAAAGWLSEKVRLSNRPKLSFLGRAGYNRYLSDKTHGAQYDVVLDLKIPIFDGFYTVYQTRQAFADRQMSMEELAELQLEMSVEVLTYARQLEAAKEMIDYALDNLESAEKAYEGVLLKYQAGKENIFDLSNAQRQLAHARLKFSDVRTRYLISAANLAYATGTLSPCLGES
jgi:outer membrane protein TolC